jgi:deazaflavin-dependent oxidoreductase (nitroreductase family)
MINAVPTDFSLKTMNALHRVAIAVSGGKLGWRAAGMPVVELTTTGRKTGQQRTVRLTSPIQEENTWIVVGSRGGDDRTPGWVLNIQSNPVVQCRFGGAPAQPVRARIATADERARLWPIVTSAQKRYAGYQSRTEREIPLVLLDRA